MPKGELLLEVRCEEIPARMLQPAASELGTRVFEELMAGRLTPSEVETGFTPRRLVLVMKGLPEREADREEQMIGPPVRVAFGDGGGPTKAALGFAKRCGVKAAALERLETDKGEYVAAVRKIEGRPTSAVLAELLPRILLGLTWPKTMRWGAGEGPWARPVHGVLCLFDGDVVPFDLFGVESGDSTIGHPVLSPKPFSVKSWADYHAKLKRRKTVVSFADRREILEKEMRRRSKRLGGELVDDPALLDKLASICGVPGVVEGSFDKEFLELPREVLIASLRDHQSALTVEKPSKSGGELLPYFLTVMDRADDPEGRVRAGNEWVVAARLADARFFYEEDKKRGLEERTADLSHLAFHAKLGSYADKTERIVALCEVLAGQLPDDSSGADRDGRADRDDREHSVAAARLLKVDLMTEMVKEFTSLQGVMGGVYARAEGQPEPVWQAIYEQYRPATASDSIPRGRAGQIVAIADRVDTLVGILGLGLVPSGSKDPFGLRRAAQGIVRIALDAGLGVDLDLLAAKAYQGYGDRLELAGDDVLNVWRPFLFDRVRHILGLQGYAYDEIEAALAVGGANLPDLKARVDALHNVREEPGFIDVARAAKRIANILRDAPEKELKQELLTEDAEKLLYQAYQGLKSDVEKSESEGRYEHCLRAIASFADVLDRFFVEVLVMDENPDLRDNRVALLQSIQRVLSRTASLTEMVVERKSEETTEEKPVDA